ncbi:MAG: FAD-binding protein [Oscillospiraceae bacterium]|nr:FAD-binding protein [Oscillospiraceae bacterium]
MEISTSDKAQVDVIVVGTGVAGLYTALELESRFKVLVLSKKEPMVCNSALAQGGVAAVIDKVHDDYTLHIEDSLIAGGYENNIENLKILAKRGPVEIENLIKLGVNFDKKDDGSIALTLEGGHSRRRIVHSKDSTGLEIVSTLLKKIKERANIKLLENAQLVNLTKKDTGFAADVYIDGAHYYYTTKTCVLATGGIGRIYDYTTNSATATGDGIYFAYNMGAAVENLSLIQFHPTAFAGEARERFLISESVRGEGAKLLNVHMKRFMPEYDERAELAPRDVICRCMFQEELRTASKQFYLDISHRDSEFIKTRFPMIERRLKEMGYDMTKEPVPVYPCQHYLMGGISVNQNGRTTVDGLYAAGECSYTGIHGKNRLASNSLLEALVFSRLIAIDINAQSLESGDITCDNISGGKEKDFPRGLRTELRAIMQKAFFVIPDPNVCKKELPRVNEINTILETGDYELTPELIETKSLALIAKLILNEIIEKEIKREGK